MVTEFRTPSRLVLSRNSTVSLCVVASLYTLLGRAAPGEAFLDNRLYKLRVPGAQCLGNYAVHYVFSTVFFSVHVSCTSSSVVDWGCGQNSRCRYSKTRRAVAHHLSDHESGLELGKRPESGFLSFLKVDDIKSSVEYSRYIHINYHITYNYEHVLGRRPSRGHNNDATRFLMDLPLSETRHFAGPSETSIAKASYVKHIGKIRLCGDLPAMFVHRKV
uniref:Predicted protein n=1 Tax=Physcomitrium patens TaxID=3218 RepID=A9RJM1_PHYPA